MRKVFTFLAAVLLTASVFAQAPEKMSYQAVIRNSSEALVTNTTVGMQISILQGSASGTAVYVETQSPTTNANGLVSLEIGVGTVVSGDFTTIDWANGTYFIKTETDPAGGTNYTIAGVSQLLSVPYALHAKTAETVTGGITETDPTFTSSQAANIDADDITNLGNLSGVNTGDQDLSTLATKTALGDSTAQVRSEIPDVSGFLTSETDPTFTSSQAANITATDITNLGNLSGVNTGDQDLSTLATKTALGDSTAQVRSEIPDVSGFLTSETDPTFTSSQAANIDADDITNLGNLSGVNTGDQDLSTLATKTALGDSTAQVRSEIPDVSGFLTSETDPTFTSSQAANITATDITNLGNLSGVNTGDQDLSTLATKTALGDSTAQVRSEIPDVSGFLTSETDPTFTSSQAANITATDITNLGNLSGVNTGDQDLSTLATKTALGDSTAQVRSEIPDVSGFLTSETDPTFTSSQAANIDADDITNLGNLSGVNTGDQDLSTLATKTALGDSTAQVRSEIPDVSGFLTSETDPTFTSSQAANITATDITNLGNLSGVNTGDQDLSTLATKTALGDSTAQVRSEIPDVSGFLTSETDPTFTSSQAANITATDITNLGNLSGVNTGDQDGSETKVTAGTNVTVTGSGTTASPYVVNSTAGGSTLAIGDSYQGGIIFWLDFTGQHGLIAATTDQSTGIQWYNGTYRHTGTTGDGLYAGAMNTTMIVATQMADNQTGNFAAKVCADYSVTVGGVTYGDWYLPSKYELNLLYLQKTAVGGFASAYYWSSTEYYGSNAWGQYFGNGGQSYDDKHDSSYVRAVRAF